MKNLLIFLMFGVISIIASESFAQDAKWKLNSISFLTGETPLTKGNTGMFGFTKGEKSFLLIDINNELGEILYFYYPVKQFSIGPSAGFLKNSPWLGPVATIELFDGHFKTLNWLGWSFGDPEERTTTKDLEFLFSYHQFSLIYRWFEAYYTLLHYQENPADHILGLIATLNINKHFSFFPGVGYILNSDYFMWSIGVKYTLNKF